MDCIESYVFNGGFAVGTVSYLADVAQYSELKPCQDTPIIIVAQGLSPQDMLRIGEMTVSGLLVAKETSNSHVSILARVMGLPLLATEAVSPEWDGRRVVLDGEKGIVFIDPSPEVVKHYEVKIHDEKERRKALNKYIGKSTSSPKGKSIRLYANITAPEDVRSVLANDAEGIGNFKTEFLYMHSECFPDEDTQFAVYRYIASAMQGKRVVIRTIDIGADKVPPYFQLEKEENPAMGYRAIRFCLDHPDIFRTQIRAILRASVYGNVAIMYPLIISVDEVLQVKELVCDVMRDLDQEGIPYNKTIEQGIMIETPAAVMLRHELAGVVDFFSIGTNDLTQFMLAIDRHNPLLSRFNDPKHPAILYSIREVVSAAHEEGIWVGISGELGADPDLIGRFLDYGVDAVALPPSLILEMRKRIIEMDD